MKSFTHTLSILPLWFYLLCLMFFFFFVPSALAEVPKYTPLVGIPGVTNSGAKSLGEYINALYLLTISVGALIGVVRISMAGVKYSMDEIVTSKAEAKEDIKGVLLGLAILLIPFIVLKTINPDLVKLNVLDGAPQVELKPSTGVTGNEAGTQTMTPQQRTELRNSCSSDLRTTANGFECCGAATYSGPFRCSGSVTDNAGSQTYTMSDINARYPNNLGFSSRQPTATDLSDARSFCPSGSTPQVFNIRGTGSGPSGYTIACVGN